MSVTNTPSFRPADRVLRRAEVSAIVGAAKSTIYEWMAKGEFPKPRKLGARAVGWLASDVDAWISSRRAA